jgi:hypothetical protein
MKNIISRLFGNSMRIIFGVLLAAVIIFLFQNWSGLTERPIELKFIGSAAKPLWFWLVCTLILGGLLGHLATFKSRRLTNKSLKQAQKELKALRIELDKLRNLSLTDDIKENSTASSEKSE